MIVICLMRFIYYVVFRFSKLFNQEHDRVSNVELVPIYVEEIIFNFFVFYNLVLKNEGNLDVSSHEEQNPAVVVAPGESTLLTKAQSFLELDRKEQSIDNDNVTEEGNEASDMQESTGMKPLVSPSSLNRHDTGYLLNRNSSRELGIRVEERTSKNQGEEEMALKKSI